MDKFGISIWGGVRMGGKNVGWDNGVVRLWHHVVGGGGVMGSWLGGRI